MRERLIGFLLLLLYLLGSTTTYGFKASYPYFKSRSINIFLRPSTTLHSVTPFRIREKFGKVWNEAKRLITNADKYSSSTSSEVTNTTSINTITTASTIIDKVTISNDVEVENIIITETETQNLSSPLKIESTPLNISISITTQSMPVEATSIESDGMKSTTSSISRPNNMELSPQFLYDDICLIPGEPIIRIEEAPTNSRRIFTGIDIFAEVDEIWNVLTNYEDLQKVIPSLVKNEVIERRADGGARLAQVGGAKVLPGVMFTAKTVLDVNIYTENNPLPPEMTADYIDKAIDSTSTSTSTALSTITSSSSTSNLPSPEYYRKLPLQRGVFPRPYAITNLPHRDITMQNVLGVGDFEHYQGIWRMQALPNCACDGRDTTRLTYAVEIRPKGFLPVGLIEGRIAADLKANLESLKNYVEQIHAERIATTSSATSTSTSTSSLSLSTTTTTTITSTTTIESMTHNSDIGYHDDDKCTHANAIAENINLKKQLYNLIDENNKIKTQMNQINNLVTTIGSSSKEN